MPRDYAPLIKAASDAKPASRDAAMQTAVDLLWRAFANKPISWVGFYDKVAGAQEMVLVCREPKPACSPIGLHGMCGRSFLTKQSILVADVRTLGESYIACDPKDQSEVVVPLVDAAGECGGVELCARAGQLKEGLTPFILTGRFGFDREAAKFRPSVG
jgi:putative methionine-R-sulfoxide reductase with GAF domain